MQLIDILQDADGSYKFDWSRLKRWCDLCLRNGIKYLEIPHLFTQWGAKAAPKIVVTVDGKNVKKVRMAYTGTRFLVSEFLKAVFARASK